MEQFREIFKMPFVRGIQSVAGEVFVVGGCVRDYFMGKEPKDIDLIVRMVPVKQLINVLKSFGKVDSVGESFGVIKLTIDKEVYDIALPRTDRKTDGEKRSNSIETQSDPHMPIEADLKRRDFTINAIAIDSKLNLVDPFGGLADITNCIIRTVDEEAFVDDPLRMMRAIQFSARFNFEIEENTMELISRHKHLFIRISQDRVLEEFKKVFNKKGSHSKLVSLLRMTELCENYYLRQAPSFASIAYPDGSISFSEWLFLSFGNHTPEELKSSLKIDNDIFDDLVALRAVDKETNFQGMFQALRKSHIVLWSRIIPFKLQFPFISGTFPKNYSELAIRGEDFMALGFEGPAIRKAQDLCLTSIFEGKVRNEREELLKLFVY